MALSDLSLSLHSVLIHSKDLPDTAKLSDAIACAPVSTKKSIADLENFALWMTKVGWLDFHFPGWRSGALHTHETYPEIPSSVWEIMGRFKHAAPETIVIEAVQEYADFARDIGPFKSWIMTELNLGEIRAELAKLDVQVEHERRDGK